MTVLKSLGTSREMLLKKGEIRIVILRLNLLMTNDHLTLDRENYCALIRTLKGKVRKPQGEKKERK